MGWQWHQPDHMLVICTLLQTDNHASTSSLKFLWAGCPSCHQPTASKHWRRKSIRNHQEEHLGHKNLSEEMLLWLSVWSEVQMTSIWSGWCHYHPIISAPEKFRMVYPSDTSLPGLSWKKRPLNECCCCIYLFLSIFTEHFFHNCKTHWWLMGALHLL